MTLSGQHKYDHPKLGRFLVVSLVLHSLVVVLLAGGLFETARPVKPPVYYVDLVHKPVLKPQAGRPEPRPPKPAPQPAKRSEAVVPAAAKPTPPPAPEQVVPVPKPKPAAKPAPTPEPQPDRRREQQLQSALDEIRERQARQAELDALKERLARMRQEAAEPVPAEVPVGMPEGSGDEAGVSAFAFVQAFIQQNWALSPYLLDQSRLADIEAKATLTYTAEGRLVRYRLLQPSGNRQFDDSLKRAITKSQQLPQPLPQTLELVVTFNLKEMAATRR